jgi:DNA-binding GntR family transcriptional regulator
MQPSEVKTKVGKNRDSLTEKAYSRLKKEIMENRMPPGFQAFEQDLAGMLNMSRTPVREALIRLQNEGLIELKPRRGMRVLPLRPSDMREIYEVLNAIECEAVSIIASRKPTLKELAPLDKAAAAMEKAMAEDDLDAWASANTQFHKSLLRLCKNKRLMNIGLNVMDQEHRLTRVTLLLRKKPIQSTREHRDHVNALLKGDAVKARKVYRQHRERALEELMETLQRFNLHFI